MSAASVEMRYDAEVRSVLAQLVAKYHPRLVLVFGSYARGELREGSDLDFLVVADSSKRWVDRIAEALATIRSCVPMDIVILTPDEFRQRAQSSDPVFRELLGSSRELHRADAA